MDKQQFTTTVGSPRHFSSQDRGWLRAMLDRYPHSSVVATLALLADHVHGFDTDDERRRVALSMCDSHRLASLLAEASLPPAPVEEKQVDILNEINTFQEVSFKTAPKSVILSNFLKAGPSNAMNYTSADTAGQHNDDKKSLRADDALATETLAIILEKQGRLDKAIEVYRKLLAANPEKGSIFAAQIERLQDLLNNK